jgi:O-antigen/teichoic acid export membrane protein
MARRPFNAAVINGHQGSADLGRRAARGAAVSFTGQVAVFVLRFMWLIIIARLVTPEHFGLFGMVSAFTGLLDLFRDVGLSAATIQQEGVSQEEISLLFWINLAVGAGLALVAAVCAPFLAIFYGEERLVSITLALACSFVLSGAVVQHRALLHRRMQFGTLALIDIGGLVVSMAVGIAIGLAGLGYWALVGMNITVSLASLLGAWVATGWKPSGPKLSARIRSMLHFGTTLTLNNFIVYVAYNLDKVLLGRFLGPDALGLYGRAYQLVSLPTQSMGATLWQVLFPALSRVQNDPSRLRSFFLRSYGLFLSVILPITAACALFAEDIVAVLLGPNWAQAAPLFRLLTPTIFSFALINPLASLLLATGRAVRSLKIALFICPVVITGYVLGLSRGLQGVALGFSTAMLLVTLPVLYWSRQGTSVSMSDIARTVATPLASTAIASWAALLPAQMLTGASPLLRVVVAFAVIFVLHYGLLVGCLGQRHVYADLWRKLFGPAVSGERGTQA